MVIAVRLSGVVIAKKIVTSISNGALKANDPKILSENGSLVTLTDDRARGILQSMDWVKHYWKDWTCSPNPWLKKDSTSKSALQLLSTIMTYQAISLSILIRHLFLASPGKILFNLVPFNVVSTLHTLKTTRQINWKLMSILRR